MKNNYFEGFYFKHQKGENTLCIIVGKAGANEFIQVITNDNSWYVPYIKGNSFTPEGIKLNIKTDELTLAGEIAYHDLSPIKYDIMGPFKFFPMECKHGIISMYHTLHGSVTLNGRLLDFNGGIGYIEKDSGYSFPESYIWIQANDFTNINNASIMASAASIPFFGFRFKGCICIVNLCSKEYRLATYLGAKIIKCAPHELLIKQGRHKLLVTINNESGNILKAPQNSSMSRTITETASCNATFKFFVDNDKLFILHSPHASFEYEDFCSGFMV